MWRAFFLAVGVALSFVGAECMVLDQAIFAPDGPFPPEVKVASEPQYDAYGFELEPTAQAVPRTWEPPEWAPWSLLSVGAIVILYAWTSRFGGGG